jgi:hypothetical protein
MNHITDIICSKRNPKGPSGSGQGDGYAGRGSAGGERGMICRIFRRKNV